MLGSVHQFHESASSLLDILQRPGVQRIFVHDYEAPNVPSMRTSMESLAALYAERALVMAQRGDVVAVAQPVDEAFLDYLEALEIGPDADGVLTASAFTAPHSCRRDLLTLLQDPAVLDPFAERIDPKRELRLSPYFASCAVRDVKRQLERRLRHAIGMEAGPPEAADAANRKDVVRAAAQELGVPTAPGEVISWGETHCPPFGAVAAAVARQRVHTGKVIVRGAWAMRGSDNLTLDDGTDPACLPRWLAQRPHQRCYLVEAYVPVVESPNLQVWVDQCASGTRVDLLHTTNQRFNHEGRHFGNVYPHRTDLSPALQASADVLSRWLAARGYVGPAGFDFIETMDGEGNAVHLHAEINARINGSTYATALWSRLNQLRRARHLAPIEAWISNTLVQLASCCSFAQLRDRLGKHLYTHDGARGVVPYNTGLLRHGTMNAVILGSSIAEAEDIEREVLDLLQR